MQLLRGKEKTNLVSQLNGYNAALSRLSSEFDSPWDRFLKPIRVKGEVTTCGTIQQSSLSEQDIKEFETSILQEVTAEGDIGDLLFLVIQLSWLERLADTEEVTGSSPVLTTLSSVKPLIER